MTEEKNPEKPVLTIRDLTKEFVSGGWIPWRRSTTRALAGVSLDLCRGTWMGVVGESGSGKTTLARILTGSVPPTSGDVTIDGDSVLDLSFRGRKSLARKIQMVHQDVGGALNPRMTVRSIIAEPLLIHGLAENLKEASAEIDDLMSSVGLSQDLKSRRPSQLSGGQKQRIGIARALTLKPRVLVLDEPVSALDVSVQAQVINLLLDLQEHSDVTVLMISHDLALTSEVCDRIAVMHRGHIVEEGTPIELIENPTQPYTAELISAVPTVGNPEGYLV